MTVETKPSNVSDSNQDQFLDDEGNKNPPIKKTSSCTGLKAFLAALSFSYFSKALSGTIMKSSITQIERRFDLTSSATGFIDGSFEMGNLLVIAFVSYFGAKLHRPKVIAVGCFTMALGCFLSAMPHFFMGYYKYETSSHTASSANLTSSINPCSLHQDGNDTILEASRSGCEKEPSSYMWIYILLGNMLRGIGETPITPLGISYLDDFAKEENVPVYVACLHTIAMMGPMFGFLLGSLCAKLYVDIGFVDPGSISITPQDSRWVGAWWLGFLIGGAASFLSAIPFCFLPKSLKKPGEAKKDKTSCGLLENVGATRNKLSPEKTKPRKWSVMLKGKCFPCCINVKRNRHNLHRECNRSAKYFASPALPSKPGSYPQDRKGQPKIIRSGRAGSGLRFCMITCNKSSPEQHLHLKFCAGRNLYSGKVFLYLNLNKIF